MPPRVALVNLSGLLGDLLSEMLRPPFEVCRLAEVPLPGGLRSAACRSGADTVVIGTAESGVATVGRLVDDYASLRVVAVVGDGERSVVYRLIPHAELAGPLSRATLLAAIHRSEAAP
jgi:hypothetical protein